MNTEIQKLIITILGIDSILSLIGVFVLVMFTSYNTTLILALIPLVTTPISLLGGFLTGKTLSEREGEILDKTFNSTGDITIENEEGI